MKNNYISDEERHLLDAIRANSDLKKCFLEMIDITQDSTESLNCGDDAEEAVVGAIRKTGEVLLQEWAEKKCNDAEASSQSDSAYRPHIKKK